MMETLCVYNKDMNLVRNGIKFYNSHLSVLSDVLWIVNKENNMFGDYHRLLQNCGFWCHCVNKKR